MGHKGMSMTVLLCGFAFFIVMLHSANGEVSFSFPE
jgi:hypothetical protein